ncbi:MAG TPA: divalent metal cation transporter [Stenomitos sp.]
MSRTPPDAPPPEPPSGQLSAGRQNPVSQLLGKLGPGFITGASDDDPSGIGTYAVAGASFGFATLWMAWITFPMMAAVQLVCAKIGMVSGRGLAGVLRLYYPRWLLYPAVLLLVVANTINAGADIGAIAAALNMFVPLPIGLMVVPVALLILAVQVWGAYRLICRIFKWLSLALFAYIGAAFFAHPDLGAVLGGTLVPTFSFDGRFLAMVVAILGTTISPYLFFWQADQEVEEEVSRGRLTVAARRGASDEEIRDATVDVTLGMLFSNLVMYFIILATAATLFKAGKTDINSATEAAEALRPLAGEAARALFALGLIGTGFLAVPILTGSAAYAVSEAFGWPAGLDEKLRNAKRFYGVIAASTVIGLGIDLVGINPIDALFWTAVINGLLAPPLLVLIMFVGNNRAIMGERVNGPIVNGLGWVTVVAMTAAAIGLIWTWGQG